MHSSTTGRTGDLPLIPARNTSNLNLTYETNSSRQLKMNTNNRTNSRNTNSRAGYLDFNHDHYLDHPTDHLQYPYNSYLNNGNFNDDRLDYLTSQKVINERVYGHSIHQLNIAQGRRLQQEDDCKSIHQYEEPMNLIRPSGLPNFKNNSLLNSLNRKYSNLQLNSQLNNQETNSLHLEMASRKESNSENSDESVLSMESDMSSDKRLTRKNVVNSCSSSGGSGSGNGQLSHIYNGHNIGNINTRKFITDGKDHLSGMFNFVKTRKSSNK